MIDIELADDVLAWELDAEGAWHKVPTRKGVDSHRRLVELAAERTRLAEDPLGGG